jgi:Protein of unknown function (DUF3108)
LKLLSVIILFLLSPCLISLSEKEDFCTLRNHTFQQGELLKFKVYYYLAGMYFSGGEASFSVDREIFNGKDVYHIVGSGKTNHFVDNSFKVRDRYETFIDTGTLKPYKFIRDVQEGKTKIYENVSFVRTANTAVTDKGVYKVPECIHDVLSAIYTARNIDFNRLKKDDKVPFTMFLDNQVYPLYIRYLGKETIRIKSVKWNAIKFKPLLINGTIFTGGEKMTVWVSDDANHIPLRLESPITVGKVVVELMGSQNLRSESEIN